MATDDLLFARRSKYLLVLYRVAASLGDAEELRLGDTQLRFSILFVPEIRCYFILASREVLSQQIG